MIGGDFDIPVMYQDLANSTMGPMNLPFGAMSGMYGAGMYGGIGNTNYLGGVKMRQQPDRDKVQIMNKKENQDKINAKKVLIGLGALIALGSIPVLRKSIKKAGGLKKYAQNGWNSLKNFVTGKNQKSGNWFTRLFHRKKTSS